MNITNTTEQSLKDIAFSLNRIAAALEEANKPKSLGNPYSTNSILNCISKDEIPLPTPWNGSYVPSLDSDVLKNQILD
jgi:hypothetical protein